jgi:hypothetical protein
MLFLFLQESGSGSGFRLTLLFPFIAESILGLMLAGFSRQVCSSDCRVGFRV